MGSARAVLLFVAACNAFVFASALDVSIQSVSCDESLAFYAEQDGIQMTCDGSSRCTFGDEVLVYGDLNYNGTEDAGVMDGTVYASGSLNFLTMKYDLFNDLPLNMCGQWVQDPNYRDDDGYASGCPEDGQYTVSVPYTLPSSGDATSWLATGWAGSGDIQVYSQQNSNDDDTYLVGHCVFQLKTAVTRSPAGSDSGFWLGAHPPSAATTSIILLVLLALLLLCCCYCACRRRKTAVVASDASSVGVGGSSNTFRNRLIDDADAEAGKDPPPPQQQQQQQSAKPF